jgi:hypothetical protein
VAIGSLVWSVAVGLRHIFVGRYQSPVLGVRHATSDKKPGEPTLLPAFAAFLDE